MQPNQNNAQNYSQGLRQQENISSLKLSINILYILNKIKYKIKCKHSEHRYMYVPEWIQIFFLLIGLKAKVMQYGY